MGRKVDLSKIPNDLLLAEAKKRRQEVREKLGPWGVAKKLNPCPGCGKLFGVRELRKHKCPKGVGRRMVRGKDGKLRWEITAKKKNASVR